MYGCRSLLASGQAAIKEFYGAVTLVGGGPGPPCITLLRSFQGPEDAAALLTSRAVAGIFS